MEETKEEAKDWLSKSVKERSKLRKNFEGIIDYYSYMDFLDKEHNLDSMKKYLDEVSKEKRERLP